MCCNFHSGRLWAGSQRSYPREGSLLADLTIGDALGLTGPVLPYACEEAVARRLLPDDFECIDPVYSAGAVYQVADAAGWMGNFGIRIMDRGPQRCR